MSVSAKDIAAKLNLSTATVSLVLNNKPGVGGETRRRVLETAAQMGFEKPIKKRPKQKKPSIQFVIYKKHGNVVADTPFFSEVSEGISSQTQKYGYTLQIIYFYPGEDLEEQLYSLHSSGSEGMILLATEMDQNDIDLLLPISLPVVLLDSYFENGKYDCVVINNEQGAFAATNYLMDMGYTDIGYLHSSVEINNFSERLNGYFKAVSGSTATYNSVKNIIYISPTIDGGYAVMYRYLESGGPLPKAFFADNDIIATSCMRALKDFGYKLPGDIAVIGFDNMSAGEIFRPALSTIHVPKQSLGVLAVDRLMAAINGNAAERVKIAVSTELVIRDSVRDIATSKI